MESKRIFLNSSTVCVLSSVLNLLATSEQKLKSQALRYIKISWEQKWKTSGWSSRIDEFEEIYELNHLLEIADSNTRPE